MRVSPYATEWWRSRADSLPSTSDFAEWAAEVGVPVGSVRDEATDQAGSHLRVGRLRGAFVRPR